MAIALVSSTQAAWNVTSGAIDTTGATFLAAVVADYGGSQTMSDSKGNTWTARTRYGSGQNVTIFYVANPTVGTSHTFSCTGSSNGTAVAAFSGVKTTSPYDVENGASSTAPGSVTPNEDNELLIAGICASGGTTYTPDGGFTVAQQRQYNGGDNTMGFALAYLIQTTAAAANPNWTGTGVDRANIATFKAAAAAAGQPTMKRFGGVPFASKVGGARGTPGVNLWRKAKELILPKPRRVIVPGFEFARGAV